MKKQVIVIMTDTQRIDMLGCYGNPDCKTPNLDRLANEGIRFDSAYTTQPVCQPARSAIFTGSYPHSCAGWSNCMGLSDNVQNIGRRLSDNGIHSAYIENGILMVEIILDLEEQQMVLILNTGMT